MGLRGAAAPQALREDPRVYTESLILETVVDHYVTAWGTPLRGGHPLFNLQSSRIAIRGSWKREMIMNSRRINLWDQRKRQASVVIAGVVLGLSASITQADIAATHIYHNHMPNFWPYYDVAQYDSLPQDGGNPTWSWLEDEIVVDHVQLQVADDAQPGSYPIYVGFYDRAENGARLPVTDGDGTLIPESWYPVAEITVAP
jgi:hypothetical protein